MVRAKSLLMSGIILIVLLATLIILLRGFSREDDWIKDSKGIWIKHGKPYDNPDYVLSQQDAISCASELYKNLALTAGSQFTSQCLGTCGDYAVDLVNVPRTNEDNLEKNQCGAYLNGSVKNFIELNNKNGEIVRVV